MKLKDHLTELFSPACIFLNLWANSNIKIRSKHSLSSPHGGSSDCFTLNPLKLCRAQTENHWSDLAIIFRWQTIHHEDECTCKAGGLMCGKPDLEAGLLTPALACINTSCLTSRSGKYNLCQVDERVLCK